MPDNLPSSGSGALIVEDAVVVQVEYFDKQKENSNAVNVLHEEFEEEVNSFTA